MTNDKNRLRALKAWETMRKRGHIHKGNIKAKSYNLPAKNMVRNDIIKILKNYKVIKEEDEDEDNKDRLKLKSIITLDTHEYLLSKELREWDIFIAENNSKEFSSMLELKPSNVFLHFGEVSELSRIINNTDVVYLDFCSTYDSEQTTILKLKEKIAFSKVFGFTFCLRRNKKDMEDYKFDLINKIQSLLTGINMRVIYGKAYKDGSPMCTILFENITDKHIDRDYIKYNKGTKFEEELTKKAIEIIVKRFPTVWSPHQIFDANARTLNIKWNEEILPTTFFELLKNSEITIPYYANTLDHQLYRQYYSNTIEGLYTYFTQIIQKNIWELWTKELLIQNGNKKEDYFNSSYNQAWKLRWQKYLVKDLKQLKKCKNDISDGMFIFKGNNYCEECFNKLNKEVFEDERTTESMENKEEKFEEKFEVSLGSRKLLCSMPSETSK
jgi:hypothetical protein